MTGDWISVPNFADGQIVRAKTFQDIAKNLDLLKNPLLVEKAGPAALTTAWTFSVVGSWVDIDADYYQISFASQGNPLLALAFIRFSHSAANGAGVLRYNLDGVGRGGTNGQFTGRDSINVPETFCFADIISPVTAGNHTLKIEVKNLTVGNTEIWKDYACLAMRVFEF